MPGGRLARIERREVALLRRDGRGEGGRKRARERGEGQDGRMGKRVGVPGERRARTWTRRERRGRGNPAFGSSRILEGGPPSRGDRRRRSWGVVRPQDQPSLRRRDSATPAELLPEQSHFPNQLAAERITDIPVALRY